MYGCHFIVLVMISWRFGIVFDELGVWIKRNSTSLAQVIIVEPRFWFGSHCSLRQPGSVLSDT